MKIKEYLRYKALRFFKANIIITQETLVKNKSGKIINKTFKVSDSLVGNFMQVLYSMISAGDVTNFVSSTFNGVNNNRKIKLITGIAADEAIALGAPPNETIGILFSCNGLSGNDNKGIVLGTGGTPPQPLDYTIETKINTGVAAGQLSYGTQISITAPNAVGAITSFKLQRVFTNNSGAPITVSELVLQGNAGGGTDRIIVYRDLISPGQLINDGQSLTVTLNFQVTT